MSLFLLIIARFASILHRCLATGHRAIFHAGVGVVSLAASRTGRIQVVVLQQVARADAFVDRGERGVAIDVLLLQFANEHVF